MDEESWNSMRDMLSGASTQFWDYTPIQHQFNHGKICAHPDCNNPCHNSAKYCFDCAALATTRKALRQMQVVRRILIDAGKLLPEDI